MSRDAQADIGVKSSAFFTVKYMKGNSPTVMVSVWSIVMNVMIRMTDWKLETTISGTCKDDETFSQTEFLECGECERVRPFPPPKTCLLP